MWSEHCSYKNSIALLKTLPRDGKGLLTEAGEENAGAVDIGDGLAVVFKIESHNHPSAIEPYQGAATGVGGILRDIFTMGARPIAALNSLRFGPLHEPRVALSVRRRRARHRRLRQLIRRADGRRRDLFRGLPTTANPLVNAMAVGICKTDRMASAAAKGEGNPVIDRRLHDRSRRHSRRHFCLGGNVREIAN